MVLTISCMPKLNGNGTFLHMPESMIPGWRQLHVTSVYLILFHQTIINSSLVQKRTFSAYRNYHLNCFLSACEPIPSKTWCSRISRRNTGRRAVGRSDSVSPSSVSPVYTDRTRRSRSCWTRSFSTKLKRCGKKRYKFHPKIHRIS